MSSDDSVAPKFNFVNPSKLVKTVEDMQLWEKSEAYYEYLGFINIINNAIKGKSNSNGSANASAQVNDVVALLNKLSTWVNEIPPIEQPQRFGNQAFRTWCTKLKNEAIALLQALLPERIHRAIPEVMVYLIEGFGNSTRIDYGTGHELSFIMFLCSLFKIGFLKKNDYAACACSIFVRYLDLARKLQTTYRMEPAGSHGVWSLDDYQFVPFIWGSNQFFGNGRFETNCFLKEDIVNAFSDDYMFLSCIQYINQVKKGPFAEHSHQLWSISAVSTWSKINGGLIRMYKAEVLSKFPLVQHIYFGSLFTLKPVVPGASIRGPKLTGSDSQTIVSDATFKMPTASSSTKSSTISADLNCTSNDNGGVN